LLSVIGGAAGVLLALAIVAAFRASPPPPGPWPTYVPIAVDARVLGFSLALTIITGLLFGLAPALSASKGTLTPALKDESFVPDERARRLNLKKTLVVAEVALSLILLMAAGLFSRSLRYAQAVDPGFDVERLLTAPVSVNLLRYTSDQGRRFYDELQRQVKALPGVDAASLARVVPVTGGGRILRLHVEGRAGADNQPLVEGRGASASGRETVAVNVIAAGYFQTMGIPATSGRDFDGRDPPTAPPVAVVSDAFVTRHFPDASPIGRRISVSGPQGPWREIIGTVSDSTYATVGEAVTPVVYLPLAQNHETGLTLFVRTAGDPAALISAVRRTMQTLEPNLPVPTIQPFSDVIDVSLYPARMVAGLVGVFGMLALTLAAVGIYSVLAFSISRRTREIGVRVALGARAPDVFALVITEGMRLVAIGVVIGVAGAAATFGALSGLLYGVSPLDAATFIAVPIALALVALAACVIPARRAARVDPTTALRSS
jgi:predicted permease